MAVQAGATPKLDIRAMFRQFYPSGRRTVYVAGEGCDGDSGLTPDNPKRTIQSAVATAAPGDRIVVGPGVYGYTSFYEVLGTEEAWITVENEPGARPVIDVSDSIAPYDLTKMTDGIDIQSSAYIAIFGLEIRGRQTSPDPNPSGIAVFRGSHHIAVWYCHVHDLPGGGINCFYQPTTSLEGQTLPGGGWDAVDIFFNTIHDTSKRSPYNTSGISFYGGEDLTLSSVGEPYGYRAVGNYIYNVICTVPYTPGGVDFVTDGNGISLDSLAVPNSLNPTLAPYLKRGLVEGNVITACGGRGVHIYNTRNVDVVNNTLIGNLRTTSPAISGGAEADLHLDQPDPNNGVVLANNLIAPLNVEKAFDQSAETVTGNSALSGTDRVPPGNQDLRAVGFELFATRADAAMLADGMPLCSLSPLADTVVPRWDGSLGFHALGTGQQQASNVVVGALARLGASV